MAWYNELPGWERDRVPRMKTLLGIASRILSNAADLMPIKESPDFSRAHADNIVRGIHQAVREVLPEQFVPIDPPPYATFEEIRLDAWLSRVRAETSAAVGSHRICCCRRGSCATSRTVSTRRGRDGVYSSNALGRWRRERVRQPVLEPFLNEGN